MDRNESNDSSLRTEHLQQKGHCDIDRCYLCQVPKFLQNFSLLLTWSLILPAWYWNAWLHPRGQLLLLLCVIIRPSLFSLFRTGPRNFPWPMFAFNFHLIQNMPRLTMLINGAASQFVVSIFYWGNIPAKVVSDDCILQSRESFHFRP